MKNKLCFIVSFLILFGNISYSYAETNLSQDSKFANLDYNKSSTIRLILDGDSVSFDVGPQIVNNKIMVPIGPIFSKLGFNVNWDGNTKTAVVSDGIISIKFPMSSKNAMINDVPISLDMATTSINGNTMIPLSFFAQNLNYNLVWIQESNMILMSKETIVEWRYGGFDKVQPYNEFEIKYINGSKTEEKRYTGKTHEVKMVNLYSQNGKLISGVPDYDISRYGTGWYTKSPFIGKTYWINLNAMDNTSYSNLFFDSQNLSLLSNNVLDSGLKYGNYVKITIEDQYFDIETWKNMKSHQNASEQSQETIIAQGNIIYSKDVILKLKINDNVSALTFSDAIINLVISPSAKDGFAVLTKNPKEMFNWNDSIWTQLRGENPWIGMTTEMLTVQKQKQPSQTTKISTKLSKIEIWIYEEDFSEKVYCFREGILVSYF